MRRERIAPMPDTEDHSVNPMALQPDVAARLLNVPVETMHRHIERGAPVAADGTINLVHYAAWLNHQLKQRHDGD